MWLNANICQTCVNKYAVYTHMITIMKNHIKKKKNTTVIISDSKLVNILMLHFVIKYF